MLEEIKKKISDNNLDTITKPESEIIANNDELLELFKDKLKNYSNLGIIQNMSFVMIKKIYYLSEFLEKFLEYGLKDNDYYVIQSIVCGEITINNILQIGFDIDNNTEAILNNFKIKLIPDIINYYKNNTSYSHIQDEVIIDYIINNKIYKLANVIYDDSIDNNPKLEQFIIEANTNDDPLHNLCFVNLNIVDKLISVNKIYKVLGGVLTDFIDEYPEYKDKVDNSLKIFLKSANEEQLSEFFYDYIHNNEELSNLLLKRLTQIKSNLINTEFHYFFHFNFSSYFNELLLDPTNPLGIDFNNYMHFFSNKVNESNIQLYLNSLNNQNEITLQNVSIFLEEIYKFDEHMRRNIHKMLINNGNFNKIEFYECFNNTKFTKIDDEIWFDYFKNKNDVPINILEDLYSKNNNFNIEESINNVINNCDEDYYMYDVSLFIGMSNDSKLKLYNKIIERLNNNKQVNFYFFLEFIISGINIDYSYLSNSNIIFRLDNETLGSILNYISKRPNNQEFTDILINKIENINEEIPVILYNDEYLNNPYFKNTLLKFIIDKKVNIEDLINDKKYLNKDVLITILNVNTYYIKDIITNIIHSENTEDITDELFNIMLEPIINTYNINKDKFMKLIDIFGIKTISLLENKQFINLLTFNDEIIDKFIEIFKVRELDKNLIVTINDSLRQNIFAKDNQDILTIYTTIVEKIQNGISDEEINNYINILLPHLKNFDLKQNLINYYNSLDIDIKLKEQYIDNIDNNLIDLFNTNKQLFFTELFRLIQINQNIYGTYLHLITNKYIYDKRNEFAKNNDITKDTKIEFIYDRKQLSDALFNYLLKNNIGVLKDILFPNDDFSDTWDFLSTSQIEEKIDLFNKIIEYLTNPNSINNLSKEEITEIKKNIKKFKVDFLYKSNIKVSNNDSNLITVFVNGILKYLHVDFLNNIKKEIIIPKRELDINEIFKHINIEVLINTVINNPSKYNILLAIIEKYKILEWGDIFTPSLKKLSISSDSGLYTFINAFDKIYDQEIKYTLNLINEQIDILKSKCASDEDILKYKKEHSKITVNPFKILKYCSIYSGFANCYKIILGLDDYELIKNNDGPFSAKESPQKRLDDTVKLQIEMMQNNKVTIPSFINSYETTNNKLMAIVGNRCASFNLTHGERTGACMRSSGYADTLFRFCNTDEKGFHITFVDPETNEYISRVSGFRNGNTVFLNQLRFSVSAKYSDDDVIIACKDVAKDLIELSKDSKMPIENVVVSPSYALEGAKTFKLSDSNIGEGVYTGYRDVNENAVILATTGKDGKPAPLKLNPNQPIYQPVRLPVLEYTNCDFKTHINIQRIKCLKQCILNKNDKDFYQRIDIDINELEKNYLKVFIGQDWFVTIDEDLNIEYDIIPGDDKAKLELEEALNKINILREQHNGGKKL